MSAMDVSIVLSLVDQVSGPARQVSNKLREMQRNANAVGNVQQRIADTGKTMKSVGQTLSLATTLPAIGMVKASADFQEAMFEWKKAADELAVPKVFDETVRAVKQMATELPLSQRELATLGASASRAGVQFNEVAKFVELAAKTADAFNLPAEQAGEALAGIKQSAGLTIPELNILVGQMDLLENSMKVRGSELVDFLNRIGALGRDASFTNSELAAIGATMIDAGIGAEVASRSLKNLTKTMTSGDSMTDAQADLMKRLGFDPDTFAKDVQAGPIEALGRLRAAILKLPEHQQVAALFELFDSQAAPAISQLFQRWDRLGNAIKTVSDETKAATQLDRSFAIMQDSLNSKLKIARNLLFNIADTMATRWMPAIESGLKAVSGFMDRLNKLPKVMQYVADGFGLLAASGPVLIVFGTLASSIAKLIGLFTRMKTAMIGTATGMQALGLAAKGLAKLSVIATVAIAIARNWETVGPAWNRASEAATKLVTTLDGLVSAVGKLVGFEGLSIGGLFDAVDLGIAKTAARTLNTLAAGVERLNAAIEAIKSGDIGGIAKGLAGWAKSISPSGILSGALGIDEALSDFANAPKTSAAPRGIAAAAAAGRRNGSEIDTLKRHLKETVDGGLPASAAANAPVKGTVPPNFTIQAEGPTVKVNQAPPIVNITVNQTITNASEAPEAAAAAVGRAIGQKVNAGMYDGVNE
jgi:TP901 family phage tail tape measure protein